MRLDSTALFGTAICIAALVALVAVVLVIERGGLIAWASLFIGIGLPGKVCLAPSRYDLVLSVCLAAAPVLAWAGTLHYVVATWESGEVVEITMETASGLHTVRLWVLDLDDLPVVYYDAGPEAAASLLAGEPLHFTRAGSTTTRIPTAQRADTLPETEANLLFSAMADKYGGRMGAADIYYTMLGRSRDRIALVARLAEE